MKLMQKALTLCILWIFIFVTNVDAQQNLAQEAYAIFEQSCLICHGENGSYTEALIIEYTALIDDGKVVPGDPDGSVFYQRLIETDVAKRMPLGQPALDPAAIETIRQWIAAGAPDWDAVPRPDTDFITTDAMLETIENHVNSLTTRDKSFARYFTLTHLYNAGETNDALNAYRRALSKLINSLSWGREVVKPMPIDAEETLFYIDLRDYEWDVRNDAWTQIEQAYPYQMAFDAPTQTLLHDKLTFLQQEMNCEVPFVHVDWFLATASLPPLYHDILALPQTDRELEEELRVFVTANLQNAPGERVWRAGFNESGVSRHNRVVERHTSSYGAYWKSYDFAGSAESQNIFTHPLDFIHDGGEIIFNLPNGLQAYYLVDANGGRLDVAPTEIVSNPAVSDPAVRNGLSCIGCHTEGLKTFEDEVRAVVDQAVNPPFNKARALELYVENTVMNGLVEEDTLRYRNALESAGGVFGGIEPIQRFYEVFHGSLAAAHAAAVVGLETDVFLEKISKNVSLQNLLGVLVLENGTVKRDAWTSNFDAVIDALNTPDSGLPPVVERPERIPGASVHIPDVNLRAALEEALGKASSDMITVEEMESLTRLVANDKGIQDLTGIEFAKNLTYIYIPYNPLSDISPLAYLTKLRQIQLSDTEVADLSPLAYLLDLEDINVSETRVSSLAPLAGLKNLKKLATVHSDISDLSPLAGMTNLTSLRLYDCQATDLSPLKNLTKLIWLGLTHTDHISDFSPLSGLTDLEHLALSNTEISDLTPLAGLVNLQALILNENRIVDVSPLASLRNLKNLQLHENNISDFSPLAGIRETIEVFTWFGNPAFPQGGPNIAGPWLWLTLPIIVDKDVDYLAKASNNKSTEHQVATLGASDGNVIGNSAWSVGMLEPYHPNNSKDNKTNLRRLLDSQDAIAPNIHGQTFVVYGSMTLYSPRIQQTKIFIGASVGQKIYLNGKLVHQDYTDYAFGAHNVGYRTFFPVTLQKGINVLLVRVDGLTAHYDLWSLFFGFEDGTEYSVIPPDMVSRPSFSASETNVLTGDTFTLNLNAENITDLAGWQTDITFESECS